MRRQLTCVIENHKPAGYDRFMESLRRMSRSPWISGMIIGVFVLWSGMVICLLPTSAAQPIRMSEAPAWHSDCVGPDVQTFCKSEGRIGLSSYLHTFALLDTDLFYRAAATIAIIPAQIHWAEYKTNKPPTVAAVNEFLDDSAQDNLALRLLPACGLVAI